HDATTTAGFDNLFDNGAVINSTFSLPTKFFGTPGHHTLMGAYSSGRYDIVDPQSLNQIPQGLSPRTILERGSWWLTYSFDQALVRLGFRFRNPHLKRSGNGPRPTEAGQRLR